MKSIDKFLQESTCGTFSKYTISVNSNDSGNIPHFHVKDTNSNGRYFHTCIQILKITISYMKGKWIFFNQ